MNDSDQTAHIAELMAALADQDSAAREDAIGELLAIGAPAVKSLIAVLENGDVNALPHALEALQRMGSIGLEPLKARIDEGDTFFCLRYLYAARGEQAIRDLVSSSVSEALDRYTLEHIEPITDLEN